MVFLHEYDAEDLSAWVRCHEKGSDGPEGIPGPGVITYENVTPEVDAEQMMEEVPTNNADVVFTTSIRMLHRLPQGGGAAPQRPHPELLR